MIAFFVSSQKRHNDDQKTVRTSIKQTKFMFLCQPIDTGFVTGKLQITGEVTRLYASHYIFFKTRTLIDEKFVARR